MAVAPAVRFSRSRVKTFVAKIAARVAVAPRNARIRITLRRIVRLHSKEGRKLDGRAVRTAIAAALADPHANRLLKPGRLPIVPKVRVKHLGRVYPTIITIDRSSFRLRLFKRLHVAKRYGVAVGLPDYPTPTGLYSIQTKQVNPTWTAPNAPWAGEFAGRSVSGSDPSNPLKARWMGVVGGVGIHGTGMEWSIGSARVARLHPHARGRRDRPVRARADRHAGLHPLTRRRGGPRHRLAPGCGWPLLDGEVSGHYLALPASKRSLTRGRTSSRRIALCRA